MKVNQKKAQKAAKEPTENSSNSSTLAQLRSAFLKPHPGQTSSVLSARHSKHAFNIQHKLIKAGLEPGHVRHYIQILAQYKLSDFTSYKLTSLRRLFSFHPLGDTIIPVAHLSTPPKKPVVVHGLEGNILEIMDYTAAQKKQLDNILHNP